MLRVAQFIAKTFEVGSVVLVLTEELETKTTTGNVVVDILRVTQAHAALDYLHGDVDIRVIDPFPGSDRKLA